MNIQNRLLAIIMFALTLGAAAQTAPPVVAFPGAEGFGKKTVGGRGGVVLEVTNLNDSGPGSFRAALQATGKRIVVFRVGGVINLSSDVVISSPNITIAGQTAPGKGITITGASIRIKASHVIMRGLRVRVGDATSSSDPDNRDALAISNINTPVQNVIIDHSSFSWAIDENVSTWYGGQNMTIQWSIISDGSDLPYNTAVQHSEGNHSKGLLVGDHSKYISIHHNLITNNRGRFPVMKGDTITEVINNVAYNWKWEAIQCPARAGNGWTDVR